MYLPEELRVVVHLGERLEDGEEEGHGEALLVLGGAAVGALPARRAVVLGAPLVELGQPLRREGPNREELSARWNSDASNLTLRSVNTKHRIRFLMEQVQQLSVRVYVIGVAWLRFKSGLSRGQLSELHIFVRLPSILDHPRASQGECNTIWPLSHFAANPHKKYFWWALSLGQMNGG